MKNNTLALVFEDRAMLLMLKNEAVRLGFAIKEPEEADMILSDSEAATEAFKDRTVIFSDTKKSGDHMYYMPRIFPIGELERLSSLMPRTENAVSDSAPGAVLLSDGVMLGGKKIKLSEGELAVLRTLACTDGCVSRDEISVALGHKADENVGNLTDVYICRLREKLEKPIGYRLITTVRGVGYRLDKRIIAKSDCEE